MGINLSIHIFIFINIYGRFKEGVGVRKKNCDTVNCDIISR
jgi:hypothetical protein